MKDPNRHIWSLDCIAICTLLGFALDDREIRKLCRKHNLYPDKDPLDAYFGFYLLHKSCHRQGGAVPKRLSRLLDERFAGIIRTVRQIRCDDELACGHDDEIAGRLDSWIHRCPAGVMWALLTDRRDRLQQYGVYLVHRLAYSAFRDGERKCTTAGEADAALAAARRDLQLSRSRFAQQKAEADDLRKRLAKAERETAELRTAGQRQQQRISELEEQPAEETRLRRRIRMLEYELSKRPATANAAPAAAHGASNGKQAGNGRSADVNADEPCRSDADQQSEHPVAPPSDGRSCPLEDLRITVIGGLDRLESRYRGVVESLGGRFSFHSGDCHAGCEVLKNAVCQSDIIVFITRVNSHSALRIVRGLCRKTGKRFTAIRETSPQALTKVLRESALHSVRRDRDSTNFNRVTPIKETN